MSTPEIQRGGMPHRSASRLLSLPKPVQASLRSTVLVPTIPHLLSELLHNSLDAQSKNIEIWIDPSREGQSIRVEDDGFGIDEDGMKQVGKRWRSSKSGEWAGGRSEVPGYGYKGEALASIAALGVLEIFSRPEGSMDTYAKVIRGSKVLFEGSSTRSLGRERGTTIIVKDLFHDIPVRQASLAASSGSLIATCKRTVETLALVKPDVRWTIWEESALGSSTGGSGPKKVLSVNGGKSSIEVFRTIYGAAGVEKVQSIRVSSGTRRIDGFISLGGTLTRSHQHLYVNGYALDKCDLHAVISKRFVQSRFSSGSDERSFDFSHSRSIKKSPRQAERHPIYVLHIQIPSKELDVSYNPGKTIMGYQDEEAIKRFLLAVVDEFLTRHEFTNPAKARKGGSEVANLPASAPSSTPALGHQGGAMLPPMTPATGRSLFKMKGLTPSRLGFAQSVEPKSGSGGKIGDSEIGPSRKRSVVGSPQTPSSEKPSFPHNAQTRATTTPQVPLLSTGKGKRTLDWENGGYEIDASGRKRYKWIDEILAEVDSGILPFTPKQTDGISTIGCHPTCTHPPTSTSAKPYFTPAAIRPTADISFTGSALLQATVLGQVDHKFICAIIPSDTTSVSTGPTLVLIDQHAADERVSIETILLDLCEGFLSDSIPITELLEPLPAIILSRQEADLLCGPGKSDILARWGIELDLSAIREKSEGEGGEYVQIPIWAIPTALKARLGRKDASEMTRLIELYLPVLEVGMKQIEALIKRAEGGYRVDWGEVLRWMPKEMLELANSKACRNAIMFGDRLNLDQCERLVGQLGKMRFPFMCAHGRPSMVPVMKLELGRDDGKRRIDWKAWKRKA